MLLVAAQTAAATADESFRAFRQESKQAVQTLCKRPAS